MWFLNLIVTLIWQVYKGLNLWPIMISGSWGYLAGSWMEVTSYFVIVLIENEAILFKTSINSLLNSVGVRIKTHFPEIYDREAILKLIMEPS